MHLIVVSIGFSLINFSLSIDDNDALTNLEGLNNISNIVQSLSIVRNDKLTSLVGLNSLINLDGNLTGAESLILLEADEDEYTEDGIDEIIIPIDLNVKVKNGALWFDDYDEMDEVIEKLLNDKPSVPIKPPPP